MVHSNISQAADSCSNDAIFMEKLNQSDVYSLRIMVKQFQELWSNSIRC